MNSEKPAASVTPVGPSALTPAERERLAKSRACVVGCGGLGCYAVELLARAGVRKLRVIDGDFFERGNLNRQLYCDEQSLGESKVSTAARRVAAIGDVELQAVNAFLTEDNAAELIDGSDIVLDALDSVPARLILARACARAGIPLAHAAVSGWRAQAAFVPPASDMLERVYPEEAQAANDGTLSFVPAFAAAVQVSEAVKALIGRKPALEGRLMLADLLTGESHTIELG